MCEKGLDHLDWVNFDEKNNVVMEEWHLLWDNAIWRETPCMEVVDLMSGAKGEEAHHLYKEGDDSHRRHVLDYYFDIVCRTIFSLELFN